MELRVLRYFLAVAQEGGVTRAAEILHLTHPTLSRQMSQLEEDLGVQLFERDKRGFKLTQDGMLLKRRAQEMLRLAEQTRQDLSHSETLSGRIAMGCGEMAAMGQVSDWIAGFRALYPQVSFDIFTSAADEVRERMDRGLADFGLLCEPVEVTPYEYIRMPQKDSTCAFFREDSPLAEKEFVTPQDLAPYPLILTRRESVHSEIAHWFGSLYDSLTIAATFNLGNNALTLAKSGVGVALSFRRLIPGIESGEVNGLCMRPLRPALETGSVLVWKKGQFYSPAANGFIRYIREQTEGLG